MNTEAPVFKINKENKNALNGGVSCKILTHNDPCHSGILFISVLISSVICFSNEVVLLVKNWIFQEVIFDKL